MENQATETREQIIAAIIFHLSFLTDGQLRMVKGFVKGFGGKKEYGK